MILLTPGPCMTSDTVRQAAALPDMNHREPVYVELLGEVRERLLGLVDTPGWRTCLIGGSGTAAVEAMVSSCVDKGPVLAIANGYYSERIVDLLAVHHIEHEELRFGWLDPWDFDQIRAKLASGRFEAVVAVHNETTTGRLNDVAKLGQLCRDLGVRCLVDAMSSFGVEAIDFAHLDAVASSANKCLHGIPGVSFVLLSDEMARQVAGAKPRTYYLSLGRYLASDTPLTPPLPAMAALRQALREMGSRTSRYERYAQLNHAIRAGLGERGFQSVVPAAEASIAVTTFAAPGDASDWIEANRQCGYLLYGCKGPLQRTHFQVANMGEVTLEQIGDWLAVVDRVMLSGDFRLDPSGPR
jgi:2-aminoethylphosphonate-pyruvate transaminase